MCKWQEKKNYVQVATMREKSEEKTNKFLVI